MELNRFYAGCVIFLHFLSVGEGLFNVAWNLCVDKCYFLSPSMAEFKDVDTYCKTLSRNAKPVDFGAKNNDSMAMQLGSCGLKKTEKESYWVNMKFSTSTKCRTIEFDGRSLFENQDFLCTKKAHPFCEADKSLCENMAQQGNSGLLSEWVAVDSTPPYYHVSTGTYTYCDAMTYCENMQTQLSHIDITDYMFLTKLHPVIKPKAGENFIIWIFNSGIQCPTATTNATVISYIGAIVHMTPSKVTTEQHLALCDSPFIPTTTTTTTTPTTTSTTTTTPTTTSTTTTTPTTTSTTTQTTTSTTPTTPTTTSTTTTTPTTTSTTTTTPTTTSTTTTTPTTTSTTTTTPTTTSTTPTTTTTTMTPTTTSTTTTMPTTTSTTPTTTSTTPTTTSTTPTTTSTAPTTTSTTPITTTTSTTPTITSTTSTTPITTLTTPPTTFKKTSTPTTSSTTTMTPRTTSISTTMRTTTSTTTSTAPTTTSTTTKTPATTSTMTTTPTTTSTTTSATVFTTTSMKVTTFSTANQSRWIKIGQQEYYVNYNTSTYENAKEFCRVNLHSSLLTFPNTMTYFEMLLKLSLFGGSYWIDGQVENDGQSDTGCLSYTQDNLTLSTSGCKFPKYSICSRSLNVTVQQVLDDPLFKLMIKEMTVEKNTTNKSIRKLICVQDNRRSAQAAGGFSVFIIGATISLLVLSDLTNFMTYMNKNKKN